MIKLWKSLLHVEFLSLLCCSVKLSASCTQQAIFFSGHTVKRRVVNNVSVHKCKPPCVT